MHVLDLSPTLKISWKTSNALLKSSNAIYARRLLGNSFELKIFNIIETFVSYIKKIYTLIIYLLLNWMQQKCNILALKPLNLSLISLKLDNNKLYINFSCLSH